MRDGSGEKRNRKVARGEIEESEQQAVAMGNDARP
jgi:hypothetical protein